LLPGIKKVSESQEQYLESIESYRDNRDSKVWVVNHHPTIITEGDFNQFDTSIIKANRIKNIFESIDTQSWL